MRGLHRLRKTYIRLLLLTQCVLVFSHENNYYNQNADLKGESDSMMDRFLRNPNNFYGRNINYGYTIKENQLLGEFESSDLGTSDVGTSNEARNNPANEESNFEIDDRGIVENSRIYEDSSEDELMIVGEDDTPRAELLKRAKRYLNLNHVNLAAYTPANPFYSYNYNQNIPSTQSSYDLSSQSYKSSGTTFSSTNSKNMESLLASCQLTNLILYRAVNQRGEQMSGSTPDYVNYNQHVPYAIGTFGALLDDNRNYPKRPPSQRTPVEATTSQPLQTYITTRSFLTTVTSTEILPQGLTLSTRLRTFAFSTSKVHTLFFTKDITPSPVLENSGPTQASPEVTPDLVSNKKHPKLFGARAGNETTDFQRDNKRLKRKDENIRIESSEIESSEEQIYDDYDAYQYGRPKRCPQLKSNSVLSTTTETKTATVVKTVTKYFNPSSITLQMASSQFTEPANKQSSKASKSRRRVPLRPVGRLFTYRHI